MISDHFYAIKSKCHQSFVRTSIAFNGLSMKTKKAIILLFGISVSVISGMLIMQALQPQESILWFEPERVTVPYDVFMKEDGAISENHLIPVGKMKGEIDGEFESFYVAVDSKGSIFINRDIEYSENAYEKSKDWKQISRERLEEYEKDLHFIPIRKGVRR